MCPFSMRYIVNGIYKMIVEASGWAEAKQISREILKREGVKAVAIEAKEVKGGRNGDCL